MKSICSELWHNVKKSIFVDIVLIAQCVLATWLFISIISYYADLPIESGPSNINGKYGYYALSTIGSEQQVAQADLVRQDPQYLEKLIATIVRVKADKRFTLITAVSNQGFPVSNEVFEYRFAGPVPADFFSGSAYPGYYSMPEYQEYLYREPHATRNFSDAIDLTVYRVDENAFNHYDLGVSIGRPFEHEDFTLRSDQKTIPLLLGDAYKPYFDVGDTFDADFVYYKLSVQVIGFLNPRSDLVSDQFLPIDGHPVSLDYAMVYPLFSQIDREIATWEDREFAEMNFEGFLNGTLVTDANVPRAKVTQIEKDLGDLFLQNGLPPLHLSGSPAGVYTFQLETQKSVFIMTGIMIIVLFFNLFCILLSLATKIQRNLKRYATELMLGQSLFSIWAGYLCEILLLCLISLSFTAYIFRIHITVNLDFLWYISGFYIVVALTSSLAILLRLKGLDIEKLIRRAE